MVLFLKRKWGIWWPRRIHRSRLCWRNCWPSFLKRWKLSMRPDWRRPRWSWKNGWMPGIHPLLHGNNSTSTTTCNGVFPSIAHAIGTFSDSNRVNCPSPVNDGASLWFRGTTNAFYYFFFNFNIMTPNILLLTMWCYIYAGSHTMHMILVQIAPQQIKW